MVGFEAVFTVLFVVFLVLVVFFVVGCGRLGQNPANGKALNLLRVCILKLTLSLHSTTTL